MNEAELQAWVDGRLPPDRQAAFDRYLVDHPAEAARQQVAPGRSREAEVSADASSAISPLVPWKFVNARTHVMAPLG